MKQKIIKLLIKISLLFVSNRYTLIRLTEEISRDVFYRKNGIIDSNKKYRELINKVSNKIDISEDEDFKMFGCFNETEYVYLNTLNLRLKIIGK